MNFGTEDVDREQYTFMGKKKAQVKSTPMTYKKFFVTLTATIVLAYAILAVTLDPSSAVRAGNALLNMAPYRPNYQTTDTQCSYARVLGASYGLNDVTRTVGHEYNMGTRDF